MLLDSSFLIRLERELDGNVVGRARHWLGSHRGGLPFVSVISIGELSAGMTSAENARWFFRRFRAVNLFKELAILAGELDRELMRSGWRLGENDNWLAATALYYGVALMTNDHDFDRVPRLRIVRF
jgi:predicted nucleic acid-binding protein